MNFKVEATPHFLAQAKKLAKRYVSFAEDLRNLTDSLSSHPEQGTPLGKGCYKIRLSIRSKGKGKSGGLRVITCIIKIEEQVYLADVYDKSEKESVTDKELKQLVKDVEALRKKPS